MRRILLLVFEVTVELRRWNFSVSIHVHLCEPNRNLLVLLAASSYRIIILKILSGLNQAEKLVPVAVKVVEYRGGLVYKIKNNGIIIGTF